MERERYAQLDITPAANGIIVKGWSYARGQETIVFLGWDDALAWLRDVTVVGLTPGENLNMAGASAQALLSSQRRA